VGRKRKETPGKKADRERGRTEKEEEWNSPRTYASIQKIARTFL
jgi:hypothetical protein